MKTVTCDSCGGATPVATVSETNICKECQEGEHEKEIGVARRLCEGRRVSGYWKGHRCGATAKYEKDGHYYCKNHLPISEGV
jgi:hypothetical protein